MTNWKDLSGPDAKIIVYSRENSSGTYVFFKEHVLKGADYTPRAQTMPGTAAVVNAVAKEKFGIGYGGAAYAKGTKNRKIKKSAPRPGGPPALHPSCPERTLQETAGRARRYPRRVDGFVSLHAPLVGGERVTQPLTFTGHSLILNASTSGAGSVRVEDRSGVTVRVRRFAVGALTGRLPGEWGARKAARTWPAFGIAETARTITAPRSFVPSRSESTIALASSASTPETSTCSIMRSLPSGLSTTSRARRTSGCRLRIAET